MYLNLTPNSPQTESFSQFDYKYSPQKEDSMNLNLKLIASWKNSTFDLKALLKFELSAFIDILFIQTSYQQNVL
jgi:hypothetical protein